MSSRKLRKADAVDGIGVGSDAALIVSPPHGRDVVAKYRGAVEYEILSLAFHGWRVAKNLLTKKRLVSDKALEKVSLENVSDVVGDILSGRPVEDHLSYGGSSGSRSNPYLRLPGREKHFVDNNLGASLLGDSVGGDSMSTYLGKASKALSNATMDHAAVDAFGNDGEILNQESQIMEQGDREKHGLHIKRLIQDLENRITELTLQLEIANQECLHALEKARDEHEVLILSKKKYKNICREMKSELLRKGIWDLNMIPDVKRTDMGLAASGNAAVKHSFSSDANEAGINAAETQSSMNLLGGSSVAASNAGRSVERGIDEAPLALMEAANQYLQSEEDLARDNENTNEQVDPKIDVNRGIFANSQDSNIQASNAQFASSHYNQNDDEEEKRIKKMHEDFQRDFKNKSQSFIADYCENFQRRMDEFRDAALENVIDKPWIEVAAAGRKVTEIIDANSGLLRDNPMYLQNLRDQNTILRQDNLHLLDQSKHQEQEIRFLQQVSKVSRKIILNDIESTQAELSRLSANHARIAGLTKNAQIMKILEDQHRVWERHLEHLHASYRALLQEQSTIHEKDTSLNHYLLKEVVDINFQMEATRKDMERTMEDRKIFLQAQFAEQNRQFPSKYKGAGSSKITPGQAEELASKLESMVVTGQSLQLESAELQLRLEARVRELQVQVMAQKREIEAHDERVVTIERERDAVVAELHTSQEIVKHQELTIEKISQVHQQNTFWIADQLQSREVAIQELSEKIKEKHEQRKQVDGAMNEVSVIYEQRLLEEIELSKKVMEENVRLQTFVEDKEATIRDLEKKYNKDLEKIELLIKSAKESEKREAEKLLELEQKESAKDIIITKHVEDLTRKTDTMESLKMNILKLEDEKQSLRAAVAGLEHDVQNLQGHLAAKNEEIIQKEADLEKRNNRIIEQQADIESLRDSLMAERHGLENQLKILGDGLNEKQGHLVQTEFNLEKARAELTRIRLDAGHANTNALVAERQSKFDRLHDEMEKLCERMYIQTLVDEGKFAEYERLKEKELANAAARGIRQGRQSMRLETGRESTISELEEEDSHGDSTDDKSSSDDDDFVQSQTDGKTDRKSTARTPKTRTTTRQDGTASSVARKSVAKSKAVTDEDVLAYLQRFPFFNPHQMSFDPLKILEEFKTMSNEKRQNEMEIARLKKSVEHSKFLRRTVERMMSDYKVRSLRIKVIRGWQRAVERMEVVSMTIHSAAVVSVKNKAHQSDRACENLVLELDEKHRLEICELASLLEGNEAKHEFHWDQVEKIRFRVGTTDVSEFVNLNTLFGRDLELNKHGALRADHVAINFLDSGGEFFVKNIVLSMERKTLHVHSFSAKESLQQAKNEIRAQTKAEIEEWQAKFAQAERNEKMENVKVKKALKKVVDMEQQLQIQGNLEEKDKELQAMKSQLTQLVDEHEGQIAKLKQTHSDAMHHQETVHNRVLSEMRQQHAHSIKEVKDMLADTKVVAQRVAAESSSEDEQDSLEDSKNADRKDDAAKDDNALLPTSDDDAGGNKRESTKGSAAKGGLNRDGGEGSVTGEAAIAKSLTKSYNDADSTKKKKSTKKAADHGSKKALEIGMQKKEEEIREISVMHDRVKAELVTTQQKLDKSAQHMKEMLEAQKSLSSNLKRVKTAYDRAKEIIADMGGYITVHNAASMVGQRVLDSNNRKGKFLKLVKKNASSAAAAISGEGDKQDIRFGGAGYEAHIQLEGSREISTVPIVDDRDNYSLRLQVDSRVTLSKSRVGDWVYEPHKKANEEAAARGECPAKMGRITRLVSLDRCVVEWVTFSNPKVDAQEDGVIDIEDIEDDSISKSGSSGQVNKTPDGRWEFSSKLKMQTKDHSMHNYYLHQVDVKHDLLQVPTKWIPVTVPDEAAIQKVRDELIAEQNSLKKHFEEKLATLQKIGAEDQNANHAELMKKHKEEMDNQQEHIKSLKAQIVAHDEDAEKQVKELAELEEYMNQLVVRDEQHATEVAQYKEATEKIKAELEAKDKEIGELMNKLSDQ